MAKDDDGLFEEPCRHQRTYRNEHQIICSDCGQIIGNDPH